MRHLTFRASALALGALTLSSAVSPVAQAGSVLLARQSTIRAAGSTGSAHYDLNDGSVDFDDFADSVDTLDSGVSGPRVSASQHSRPSVSDAGGGAFAGAYAEGSASVVGDAVVDFAEAASAFDLTFQVLGEPSVAKFGGSVGVTGGGSTAVSLSNQTTGDLVLAQELLGAPGEGQTDGRSIDHSTVLEPGVYELLVTANVNGAPQGMAYYTVSLSLAPLEPPGMTPIPLPPAGWGAAGTLLAAAGAGRLRRAFRARP